MTEDNRDNKQSKQKQAAIFVWQIYVGVYWYECPGCAVIIIKYLGRDNVKVYVWNLIFLKSIFAVSRIPAKSTV